MRGLYQLTINLLGKIARVALSIPTKVKLPQQRFGLGLAENLRACPGCGLDLTAAAPPAQANPSN